ncbi:MAG: hypothetical protein IAE81_02375 [Caldilineaceae bacterium]|nr:hypothetical protein [Caldilineaceae bacterium]
MAGSPGGIHNHAPGLAKARQAGRMVTDYALWLSPAPPLARRRQPFFYRTMSGR